MQLTRVQKLRLGTFVIAGLILLIGSFVMLMGVQIFKRELYYTVRFAENVSGLETSAQVKYRGLRVGRVEKMRIDPADPESIEVTLALQPNVILYEGTQAVLDISGLTGLKTVNLIPGDPRQAILPPGSNLPVGPSYMGNMMDQATAIFKRVEEITRKLQIWLDAKNLSRIEHFVDSLDRLAVTLEDFLNSSRLPFAGMLQGFTSLSEEGAVTLHSLAEQLAALDPNALANTLKALRGSAQALEMGLAGNSNNLAVALKNLSSLVQNVDLLMTTNRDDLSATLRYIREASEDMREFSRLISQNPAILLRGREVKK